MLDVVKEYNNPVGINHDCDEIDEEETKNDDDVLQYGAFSSISKRMIDQFFI